MSPVVLSLDDPRCRDVRVAGGKAAGLWQARAAGLPVLDGVVVPASAAEAALRAGVEALATRGSGGARRAAMATPVAPQLVQELRSAVAALGGDVIVRSSGDVEAAGVWAGAFSTFSDIGPDEVATAVRGCWASVFGVDAIERGERTGRAPGDLAVAVLLQPRIRPVVAGLARYDRGCVEVVAVRGSPGALTSGWADGHRVMVADGSVTAADELLLDEHCYRQLAQLAAEAHERLGHSVIEWAWTGDCLVLLQSMAGPAAASLPPADLGLAGLDHPSADRVAALALAFPGSVGDELVFPWALGMRDPVTLAPEGAARSGGFELWAARQAAGRLAAGVWGTTPDEARSRCERALRALRSDTPAVALEELDRLAEPDVDAANELLGQLLAVGAQLRETGLLRSAEDVLGCDVAALAPDGIPALRRPRSGAGRWEPFLVGVAQTRGATACGLGAASGSGAGRGRVVQDPHDPPVDRRPREIIVAARPVPALSPLLWDAAGLVTTGGSPGAHLIEVARSLGVPAVVACESLPAFDELDGRLLAVDGDAGTLSHHRLPRRSALSSQAGGGIPRGS